MHTYQMKLVILDFSPGSPCYHMETPCCKKYKSLFCVNFTVFKSFLQYHGHSLDYCICIGYTRKLLIWTIINNVNKNIQTKKDFYDVIIITLQNWVLLTKPDPSTTTLAYMCSWCKTQCKCVRHSYILVCGGAVGQRLTAGCVGWPGSSSGADSAASREHWGARDWATPPAKRWKWQLPASGARGHLELGASGWREIEEEGERETEMKAKSRVAYAPEQQCECVGGDVM